jgi:CRP/FNR family transcriptional regulator
MRRRNSCLDCAVRNSALCRALSPLRLAELKSYRRRYPPGQIVPEGHAPEDRFAIILAGVIKLTKSLPDGRHQIVALLFPSDFLGRPFGAGGQGTAETATDVELCCFNQCTFEQLLREEPALKQLFLERTLDDVEVARDWMLLLGQKRARERVAAFILLMLRRMRGADCASCAGVQEQQFDLPLSTTEIGDFLGLRMETVSRQLKLLRDAGVIEIRHRTIAVRDIRALEQAAE